MASKKAPVTRIRTKPEQRGTNYNDRTIQQCLVAVVKNHGSVKVAAEQLAEDGITVDERLLARWCWSKYRERYQAIREKLTPEFESGLARDLLDVAGRSIPAQQAALDRALQRLEAGEEQDPSRAAVNLARVAQMSTDKMLTLTGRPATITENHDVEGLLRSLVSMGILRAPDEPVAIEATAEEDTAA